MWYFSEVWNKCAGSSLFLFAFCSASEWTCFLSLLGLCPLLRVVFPQKCIPGKQPPLPIRNQINSRPEFPVSRYSAVTNLWHCVLLHLVRTPIFLKLSSHVLLLSFRYWKEFFLWRFLSLSVPCSLFFIVHYLLHTVSFQSFIFLPCIPSYLLTFSSYFSFCFLVSCSFYIFFLLSSILICESVTELIKVILESVVFQHREKFYVA